MKHIRKYIYAALIVAAGFLPVSCDDNDAMQSPEVPVIKELILPDQFIPGAYNRIEAYGFRTTDRLYLQSLDGNTLAPGRYDVEKQLNVTAFDLRFAVPDECRGAYALYLVREGCEDTYICDIDVALGITGLEDYELPDISVVRGEGALTFESNAFLRDIDEFVLKQKEGQEPFLADTVVKTTYKKPASVTFQLPEGYLGKFSVELKRGVYLEMFYDEINVVNDNTKIGDWIEGGVVFYLDPIVPGKGMVASFNDALSRNKGGDYGWWQDVIWGAAGPDYVGTSTALGTGAENSRKIVAHERLWWAPDKIWPGNGLPYDSGDNHWSMPGAIMCETLVGDIDDATPYTDWYLPSIEEVTELVRQKDKLERPGGPTGREPAINNDSWFMSSSEVYDPNDATKVTNQVWVLNSNHEAKESNWQKRPKADLTWDRQYIIDNARMKVRCVRSFSLYEQKQSGGNQ